MQILYLKDQNGADHLTCKGNERFGIGKGNR